MVLAQSQKDNLSSSAIGECWGYADIQIGNVRLTYQASGLAHGLYDLGERSTHHTGWVAGEDST